MPSCWLLTSQRNVDECRPARKHPPQPGRHADGPQSRHGEGNREPVSHAVQRRHCGPGDGAREEDGEEAQGKSGEGDRRFLQKRKKDI